MKQDIDQSQDHYAVHEASHASQDVAEQTVTSQVVDTSSSPVVVFQARPGWHLINFRELWRYRELLGFLAIRDIKVRYHQTLFGIVWAVVPPIVLMIVFTFIFGKIAKFPTGGIPYPLFVYAGLLAWKFFTTALSDSVYSVVGAGPMITKVYFPRLVLPFSRVAVAVIDFAVAFVVLACLMVYYEFMPGWRLAFVPLLTLLTAMAALGIGSFLAALNVSFRDVRQIVPFAVQIGLFLTPAIYMDTGGMFANEKAEQAVVRENQPSSQAADSAIAKKNAEASGGAAAKSKPRSQGVVPDRLQALLYLNPVMGLIESFRAAILNRPLPWMHFAYSASVSLVLFFIGCMYFERVQRNFADVI